MLQPKSKNVITLFTHISHYVLMTETNQTSETERHKFYIVDCPGFKQGFLCGGIL